MNLTLDNYYSIEADKEFMSVSQFKNFELCEAKAYHDLQVEHEDSKACYIEGQLFENLVAGDANLFMSKHPEMVSSKGPTAGQLKAEYKKVLYAAERFNDQKFFKDIINKCEKQVILTGEIEGIKVKCCLDLLDKETNSIYDIKCMKDFKEQWNKEDKKYIPWYYNYGYVLQLAVYRELVRQNFGEPKILGLIAATKEEEPDLQALRFDSELLDIELEKFKSKIVHYNEIKLGNRVPISCNYCDYCKSNKEILSFEEVK